MKKLKLYEMIKKEEVKYDDKEFIEIYFAFNNWDIIPEYETMIHILSEYQKYSGDMDLEAISLSLACKVSDGFLTEKDVLEMNIDDMIDECY